MRPAQIHITYELPKSIDSVRIVQENSNQVIRIRLKSEVAK